MTEKEKTIELSTEPTEKKKPHRRRAVVITVVALALLAAGGIAWKTHTDHLMAEARADCAAESERLHVATTAYNALLDDQAASMAKTDVKSVKDTKTLDALSKAVKASTPKTVSCKADSRDAVVTATKAITANTAWYWTHGKSLNRLVNTVETSKLDKTVDDANALYKETDGKVADGKTRASLLDAIKKRDAAAIAKAVKEVNESKAAKEQADAEAKARAEQEAAAAAAQQQAQASQSQTYSGGGSYSNRGYSHSDASPAGSGGSASSPSQSNGGGSSAGSGSDLHIVIGGSGTPAQNGPSHGEPNI
ncbi:colicin transporter [Bifidobacterium dentium]|uniref:colicin transporter n=1 Tax=Bifidobacterium dentium TaxID=1689 RepID=UPI001FD72F45|nr:colicin transporter [Bifidobacterium dentium]